MNNEPRILVVDDEPKNRELIRAYLTPQGYQIIDAIDGEDALNKVKEFTPDLILLDVIMPKENGFEVCRILKASPDTLFIPIVIVTVLSKREDRIKGIEAGADDFLSKPIDAQELISRVKSLLRIKTQHDEIEGKNRQLTTLAAELDRHNSEVTLLNEMSEQLQICLTTEEAYSVIKKFVNELFPDESGALYIINASRNFLEDAVTWGGLAIEPVFSPDDCWALRRGQSNLVNASHSGVLCRHIDRPMAFKYYMCLPMMAQGETVGVLNIRHLKNPGDGGQAHYSKEQKQLGAAIAEHISSALANLRLRQKLREQSIRDPLTELFNRRYMEEFLERELHRAKRSNAPIGIIMFDIDDFKVFNDTAGHDAGDKVLQALAALMKAQIREEDIACRFGGEEFILILPEMTLDKVKERAEDLRSRAQSLALNHKDKPLGPITISLGVAVFPLHGATAGVLIKSADKALYRAKESGKNRVVVSELAGTYLPPDSVIPV
ncbi:MAG: diguanylate cyclase [Planctomycetota bacterium]